MILIIWKNFVKFRKMFWDRDYLTAISKLLLILLFLNKILIFLKKILGSKPITGPPSFILGVHGPPGPPGSGPHAYSRDLLLAWDPTMFISILLRLATCLCKRSILHLIVIRCRGAISTPNKLQPLLEELMCNNFISLVKD